LAGPGLIAAIVEEMQWLHMVNKMQTL